MSQLASILLNSTMLNQVYMIAAVVSDPSFFADVRERMSACAKNWQRTKTTYTRKSTLCHAK